ncbi:MAG: CHAP domain-containing protein [Moraxellaceae bacterium]|nr:CHAP domain-containing protein [Moraxellaceae bacterium]
MKKTLMMVTAVTVGGVSQANAAIDINNVDVKKNALIDVKKDANSGVQEESTASVEKSLSEAKKEVSVSKKSSKKAEQVASVKKKSSSKDALAKKIEALQNELTGIEEVKPVKVSSNKKTQKHDDIGKLIAELESKATTVTLQNDKLSQFEASLQAKRLAKKKELIKSKLQASVAKVKAKEKASTKRKAKAKPTIKAKAKFKAKLKSFSALKASYSAKAKTRKKAKRRYNRRNPAVIAARKASRRAHSRSRGLCAKYVRRALQSAGYKFKPNPSAYQYATRGTLRKAGFTRISNRSKPRVGDVVVVSRSRRHPHGHISIYDGRNWVSDFRQRKANPYKRHYSYTTWRDTRYANNNGRKGLYMASR